MKILFLGDVLGRTGRDTVAARLPGLRKDLLDGALLALAEKGMVELFAKQREALAR